MLVSKLLVMQIVPKIRFVSPIYLSRHLTLAGPTLGKLVSLSEQQLVDCDHEERAGEEAIDMEDFFFEGIACRYKQL
ncbi:hypothetical protein F0562_011810 [Nyssa sinensis]|uniref:Uncharacterized protein n=1 Tax=Nyssa sinensis TaxID=561372 RepID=A0A5J4ZVI6_9ASTE|nr:hypothetical protein F0562_011810 [Nyssa sinensis]